MKLAVMQPYIFPYIGYFQLINSVDTFVYYDDVNFIKQGWINRNRILVNRNAHLFTVPIEQISSFKLIKDVKIHDRIFKGWKEKFIKTIEQSYRKAPFFQQVFPLVISALNTESEYVSDMAETSVNLISKELKLKANFLKSSISFSESKGMDKAERLVDINNRLGSKHYINPAGGVDLYEKSFFADRGISLSFIKSCEVNYKQFDREKFEPWLSIIDVLMFNSHDDVKAMLEKYELT